MDNREFVAIDVFSVSGMLRNTCVQLVINCMISRLGFVIDFLSKATLLGFMAGAAVIVSLQQLKGLLGIVHFTTKMQMVPVMISVFEHRDEVNSFDALKKKRKREKKIDGISTFYIVMLIIPLFSRGTSWI